MTAGRTLGKELERARRAAGMSIEDAAAKADLPVELWEALEEERATRFVLSPQIYAAAARALRRQWALVSG